MLREIITAEEEDSGQLDILKAWVGISGCHKVKAVEKSPDFPWLILAPFPMFLNVQVTRAHKRMQAVLLALECCKVHGKTKNTRLCFPHEGLERRRQVQCAVELAKRQRP